MCNGKAVQSSACCMLRAELFPQVLALTLHHGNKLTGIKHIMAGQKHTYTQ